MISESLGLFLEASSSIWLSSVPVEAELVVVVVTSVSLFVEAWLIYFQVNDAIQDGVLNAQEDFGGFLPKP